MDGKQATVPALCGDTSGGWFVLKPTHSVLNVSYSDFLYT